MEDRFAIPENYTFHYQGRLPLTPSERIIVDLMYITFSVICQAFVIFGIFTNIINIIVFKRLGFKETVNISFVALSISNLFACATLVFQNLSLTPLFMELELSFDPTEVNFIVSGWPNGMFTKITSVIKAFITLERLLCVTLPFKVRTLVTRKRVVVFIVCTYIIFVSGYLPMYATHRLGSKFSPLFNKSLIGLVYTKGHEQMERGMYIAYSIYFPTILNTVIIVCTVLLAVSLKRKSAWRQTSATVTQSNEMAAKEKRIATMVVTVSILFIVCFSPIMAVVVVTFIDEEFSIDGKRNVLFGICFSYTFILKAINSPTNIFIYYFKNSKYRAQFNQIFCRKVNSTDEINKKT